ncbi:hypothetical protein [Sorangium sp. So ce394]|uniref:hypothetical protein n=1 Tax=Sorangium sp. So ce394 TaxID=3133310 RepID=UPI003F5B3AD5
MRFRLHPRALQEFEEAVDYYLDLSPEVASRFVDAFEAAVSFVRALVLRHDVDERGARGPDPVRRNRDVHPRLVSPVIG